MNADGYACVVFRKSDCYLAALCHTGIIVYLQSFMSRDIKSCTNDVVCHLCVDIETKILTRTSQMVYLLCFQYLKCKHVFTHNCNLAL